MNFGRKYFPNAVLRRLLGKEPAAISEEVAEQAIHQSTPLMSPKR
jgi:hypothetical protein